MVVEFLDRQAQRAGDVPGPIVRRLARIEKKRRPAAHNAFASSSATVSCGLWRGFRWRENGIRRGEIALAAKPSTRAGQHDHQRSPERAPPSPSGSSPRRTMITVS